MLNNGLRELLEQKRGRPLKVITRRSFTGGVIAAGFSGAISKAMPAEPNQGKNLETNTPFQKVVGQMNWFNEPPAVKLEEERLVVLAAPKTDFWRKTLYAYVSDNGHFLYASVRGNFTLEARIAGQYQVQYDQAGLMVRVDSAKWMKCGVVLSEGIGHATVVVTREFSDWSTVPGITTKAGGGS